MASVFHGGPRKKPPKRHKIAGARISCVLYLCKPLFQGNTKGDAWLNPFYFLSSVCVCVCLRGLISGLRPHLVSRRPCRLADPFHLASTHPTPPPTPLLLPGPSACCQRHIPSARGPGMGLGASAGGL